MRIKSNKKLGATISLSFSTFYYIFVGENKLNNWCFILWDFPQWIISIFYHRYGIAAITLGRLILFFDDLNDKNEDLLIHEYVHIKQYKKYTWIVFWLIYLYEYMVKGYVMVSFEREAYKVQSAFVDFKRKRGEEI